MDEVVRLGKRVLALGGLEGFTLAEWWDHLSWEMKARGLALDDYWKAVLWIEILSSSSGIPDIHTLFVHYQSNEENIPVSPLNLQSLRQEKNELEGKSTHSFFHFT